MENREKTCFVICPIGEEKSEIRKHADILFDDIIEPICEKHNIKAIRSDKIVNHGIISNHIIQQLKISTIVIADLAGHNPNVFYELGIRHALSKPAILIKNTKDSRPFDIQSINIIDYDSLDDRNSSKKLKSNLEKHIQHLLTDNYETDTPFYDLLQENSEKKEWVESVNMINTNIKGLREDIINTFSLDILEKTRINARYIDGEEMAFQALTTATKNAKKEIRSSRFFPDSVLSQNSYVNAIAGRVNGSDGKKSIQEYYRIVALNNKEKIGDVIHHITLFKGQPFILHLTKLNNAFELVVIDDTDAFIHFYKKKQVISSTLHIQEKNIVWEFKEIYDKMLENTEESLIIDCSKIDSNNFGDKIAEVTKIFDDLFPDADT